MVNKNSLKLAEKFYKKSLEEYKKAKRQKDDLLFRNAAEKAWNAVVQATDYFIEKMSGKKAKSHSSRRKILSEIEEKYDELKKYYFFDRFMARCHFLHELCLYEGVYTEDELRDELEKVKTYIGNVTEAINVNKWR